MASDKLDREAIGQEWLRKIARAEKREDRWMKSAARAEAIYLCDDEEGPVPDFNILHSNVETIVPAIYNSTPEPDVRPRHNAPDPVAKMACDVYERVISAQIDDDRLNTEIESVAQDGFAAGRGIIRLLFDADVEEVPESAQIDPATGAEVVVPASQTVSGERVTYEAVAWSDYREGPAKRWNKVPWVAFRHSITQAEMERISDEEARSSVDDLAADNDDCDRDIWEIWCRETKTVKFITAEGKLLAIEEDPLGLKKFFPMPAPVQPITGTGKRTPVCPYDVYKALAGELDLATRRINAVMRGLKVRGAIAGNAEAIELIAQAGDNELVPLPDLENLAALGGIEKAVMWWPVDMAIAVLAQLYTQREQTKQAIYEITGISDIVRGASNAGETATAQQIKTQWGSLRVKKMQRLIERTVRDVFGLTAEIISTKFSPEAIQKAAGMEIPPEVMQMVTGPIDHLRIDVESDSTVRADLTQKKGEMGEFLNGTAQFFTAMAPIVQQSPATGEPVAQLYSAFARQFSLGKQAEDAIESMVEQAAASKDAGPGPEEQAMQAQMQLEQQKMMLEAKKADAELQIKQVELQIKQAELRLKEREIELAEHEATFNAIKSAAEFEMGVDQQTHEQEQLVAAE